MSSFSNASKVLLVVNVNDAIADAGGQIAFVASFQMFLEPTLPAVHFVGLIVMSVSLMMG